MATRELEPRTRAQIGIGDLRGHEHARRSIGIELAKLEFTGLLVEKDVDARDRYGLLIGNGGEAEFLDFRAESEEIAYAPVAGIGLGNLVHNPTHRLRDPSEIGDIGTREDLWDEAPLDRPLVVASPPLHEDAVRDGAGRDVASQRTGDLQIFVLQTQRVERRSARIIACDAG